MIEQLQEIIRQYVDDESIILTGDMVLLNDLGLNSLDLVELVCELEGKLDLEIPDRAISEFKTVQNVLDYIAAANNK